MIDGLGMAAISLCTDADRDADDGAGGGGCGGSEAVDIEEEGVIVTVSDEEFPVGLVLVSFKCLPFTMSARFDIPSSGGGGGGGGGAVGIVEPPANGGK